MFTDPFPADHDLHLFSHETNTGRPPSSRINPLTPDARAASGREAKQRDHCSSPCNSGAAAVISRTRGAPPFVHASERR